MPYRNIKKMLILVLPVILMIAACSPDLSSTAEQTTEETTRQPTSTETLQSTTQSETIKSDGCTLVSKQLTPKATEESLIPPTSEDDWMKGPGNADVVIIEYGDFQ